MEKKQLKAPKELKHSGNAADSWWRFNQSLDMYVQASAFGEKDDQ